VIEKDVVDPVESAIVSIEGIKKITSSCRTGSANVSVEFVLGKDIDIAVQEVQTAISRAQRNLPDNLETPTVTKSNPEDRPIMWISVRSEELSVRDLMYLVKNQIRDQFSTLSGVSEILLGGYVDPALRIDVSLDQLSSYQLSVSDVITAIQNEHIELPAGRIEGPEIEQSVRVMGEVAKPEEFKNIAINRRGGGPNYLPISLGKIAGVSEGLSDVRRISRVAGAESVGIGIRKQRGANSVEVASLVKERMKVVQSQLPEHVKLAINYDSTPFIKDSVNELLFTILLAALLTAIVCWIFLGSLSSTFNIVLAIPTSILGTFIFIHAFGFTLNSFSLLGLFLAIVIVVDDAIIVLENIMRHRDMGKNRIVAALDGSQEITFAVVATTLALVSIFVPVTFMEGIIGKFFFEFAATICVAVGLSSLEALTLAPMRCSQFLESPKRDKGFGKFFESLMQGARNLYAKLLPKVLHYRWITLIVAALFFIGSLFLLKQIPKEFSPKVDEGRLFIILKTKEGSSMEFTSKKVRKIEEIVMQKDYIDRYFAAIGGFQGGESNTAFMFVTLKDLKDRPIVASLGRRPSQVDTANLLREDFKNVEGIKPFIQESSGGALGGGRGFPVEFSIRGPQWSKLVELTGVMKSRLEKEKGFTEVNSDDVNGAPEIHVIPNREKSKALGVDIAEISRAVQVLFGGYTAALYSKGGQRYDVIVQLQEKDRKKVESIARIMVRNNRGELIPLKELVTFEDRKTPPTIVRQDRVRAVSITSNLTKDLSQSQAMDRVQEIAKEVLPEGYYVAASGSVETFQESFRNLMIAMALGIIVDYMVLASQFNSFADPIVVLTAIPFAVTGALIGLLVTGQSLNIYSFIGMILLMGIAKKNSILLVEFTNQLREEGKSIREALCEACPIRLRPILMTTLSTIAAAAPAALSLGPGAETRMPMGVVILAGMVFSTVFTLFVVPCFYDIISPNRDTFEQRLEKAG
ncbi:MAG: efflux RND transporter permease subunit, partial [Bdellovibrionales bacterium]|nr:efflux RND transporter permease subunit [Bdellovibrionales bacterium]